MFQEIFRKGFLGVVVLTAVLFASGGIAAVEAGSYTFPISNRKVVYVASTTHNLKFWLFDGDPRSSSGKTEFVGEMNFWWEPNGSYEIEIVATECGFIREGGRIDRGQRNFPGIAEKVKAAMEGLSYRPCGHDRTRVIEISPRTDNTRQRTEDPIGKLLFSVISEKARVILDDDFWSFRDY
jgi:hypothetical protein